MKKKRAIHWALRQKLNNIKWKNLKCFYSLFVVVFVVVFKSKIKNSYKRCSTIITIKKSWTQPKKVVLLTFFFLLQKQIFHLFSRVNFCCCKGKKEYYFKNKMTRISDFETKTPKNIRPRFSRKMKSPFWKRQDYYKMSITVMPW